MARHKKTMIGFDPLAWLDKDSTEAGKNVKGSGVVKEKNTGGKDANTEKKSSKHAAKDKIKKINILGHSIDETALAKGYALASEVLEEVAANFYGELFKQHPEIEPLFKDVTVETQAAKLSAAINLLVDNLHNEAVLLRSLEEMGKRHQGYGAKPEQYPVVVELLLDCFKKKVGRSWTKAVHAAWSSLLGAVAETMYSVYTDEEDVIAEDNNVETGELLEFVEDDANVNEFSDKNMPENPVIQLKSVQDISKSQSLKNDLVLLINDNDEIDIDGSLVERIDGSALQLICALFIYSKQNNLIINWLNPSDALIRSAEIIGVNKILELS